METFMKVTRSLVACAALVGMPVLALMPAAAMAQTVNPYLPMTTKPPGPVNPATPAERIPGTPRDGVIKPPAIGSRMPVIEPKTPSRMPIIHPPGTPGSSPSTVVPK